MLHLRPKPGRAEHRVRQTEERMEEDGDELDELRRNTRPGQVELGGAEFVAGFAVEAAQSLQPVT